VELLEDDELRAVPGCFGDPVEGMGDGRFFAAMISLLDQSGLGHDVSVSLPKY
jgi:hypothetical protein